MNGLLNECHIAVMDGAFTSEFPLIQLGSMAATATVHQSTENTCNKYSTNYGLLGADY